MEIKEIGVILNGYETNEQAPRQAFHDDREFIMSIHPKYMDATKDFAVGDYIQVIYFADKSKRDVLQTMHPRYKKIMGVFSSRSPHRPNPLLICVAKIIDINENKIKVKGLDALNNSKIIDIKTYSKEFHDKLL
ncbi:tRNA (N6-threonylcarbamoyladenosine(37)-N6)-methyltransferase TrmO [Oceanivirga salmonicida]|uniref:tRNA (N6-threonylcarbamoyladenosine(37)-N6)-methyltransferase TrmO n=1 Tax=Oceanivirga salmonicida TaxID=1769291 RepID=UPI00082E8054|nr:tRNA (N6-threonylcarbamoyladenosine(37)-N6)-methyltransferase TrmO [Oceanivirga salmonicida]